MTEQGRQIVLHPFEPVYDCSSRILILGSLPSVLSRQNEYYYGNPQNRFWRVLSQLLESPLPTDNKQRETLLLDHHIALWDVIGRCKIRGSSDSSIADPVANDIQGLLKPLSVRAIFCNGKAAARHYDAYRRQHGGMACVTLPSTSPANARCSLDNLVSSWRVILDFL